MIVTIVTPTLNGIGYLRECIESTRRNEFRDVEIEHVIVDGGSSDGTVELAESFGLRVMKGKDKGIFDAINKGSFDSSGQLLGFLGADDVMLNGAVQAVVRAYRVSGGRWVVGSIRWIDEHDRSMGRLAAPPRWMTPRMHACLGWNPIMHMATYFSREFFVELGGFDVDYRDSGDYEMFARALCQAPYVRLDRPVACFRRTGLNNSLVNRERMMRENTAVRDRFGPHSRLEYLFCRYTLMAWLNLTSPTWLIHKKITEPVRIRMGVQEKSYF